MSLLVRRARLITVPSGTDDPGYIEEGWMLVGDDGRIDALGAGDPPTGTVATETLDVDGAFVAPGFVSSHSHLFTSGLRGLGVADTLYGWCDSMLGSTAHMSADQLYWSTLHGSLDFLSNGVTTAYNFTDPLQAWESMVDGKRTGTAGIRPLEYHYRQADGTLDSGIRFVDASGMDATVGTDDKVVLKTVTIARDLGKVIELGSGLALGDRVIESPPDGIADGDAVRVAEATKTKQ